MCQRRWGYILQCTQSGTKIEKFFEYKFPKTLLHWLIQGLPPFESLDPPLQLPPHRIHRERTHLFLEEAGQVIFFIEKWTILIEIIRESAFRRLELNAKFKGQVETMNVETPVDKWGVFRKKIITSWGLMIRIRLLGWSSSTKRRWKPFRRRTLLDLWCASEWLWWNTCLRRKKHSATLYIPFSCLIRHFRSWCSSRPSSLGGARGQRWELRRQRPFAFLKRIIFFAVRFELQDQMKSVFQKSGGHYLAPPPTVPRPGLINWAPRGLAEVAKIIIARNNTPWNTKKHNP